MGGKPTFAEAIVDGNLRPNRALLLKARNFEIQPLAYIRTGFLHHLTH
jgi:hypothetical protein